MTKKQPFSDTEKLENVMEKMRAVSMAMESSGEMEEVYDLVCHGIFESALDVSLVFLFCFDNQHLKVNIADIQRREWRETDWHEAGLWFPDDAIESSPEETKQTACSLSEDKLHQALAALELPDEFMAAIRKKGNIASSSLIRSKKVGLGFIRFSQREFSTEENKALRSLLQVLEQSFIRHADLKRIERYEREAEIEEALEIVRARSLAMRHTSELQDLVNVVSVQLVKNQININGGVFITINDEVFEEGVPIWGSGGLADYVQKAVVPYIDNPIFINLRDAILQRTPFMTELISKEHKVEFFEHLFSHSPWSGTAPEIKKMILTKEGGYARSVTISKYTTIFMLNNVGIPFSDFDNQILKRFGKVLEQSYGRFLDLKKMEEEARQLVELEAAKSRLYTNITHEFRTPLTVISGMADQIAQDPKKWLDEGVEMIHRNSTRLLQLVNQMLGLSKLESGEMPSNLQQSDMLVFLKYILRGIHSQAESKGIEIHFSAEVEELIMDFDKEKIQQIMVNLLSNAIKFTPVGGSVFVDIKTRYEEEQEWMQIIVKDTGIGISAENLPHIFNRFYQVDDTNTRTGDGSGIGLALVYELVQWMKGEIIVKSEPGTGTEFTILLPVTHEAAMEDFEEQIEERISKHEVNFEELKEASEGMDKPRILLIEDNQDVVTYIVSCLFQQYEIEVATDGLQGIEKALNDIPDLIISDVMMPEKDGFEVCNTLKKDLKTSHIPIILLTARADIESRLEGLEQGADAYLAKPFHKKELSLRISKLLESRESLRQYYLSQLSKTDTEALVQNLSVYQRAENEFLEKLGAIVEENLENPDFNVEAFCKETAMSHSQLHRKLMALTAISPNRFIRKIRLKKACDLLKNSSLNISEIAYNTGFNDPAYFSRLFKQEFDTTPLDWRAMPN